MALNWAGQQIEPGAVVWRGARDGNTSSFKVGRVVSVDDDKETARVQWVAEQGYRHERDDDGRFVRTVMTARLLEVSPSGSRGGTIHALTVISPWTLSAEIRKVLEL
ncbi:hypothetical protein SEA_ILLUMINE_62 [Mycobacterium phage Illumine]|nr:hypothetical protein SEA_DOLE_62 [Mycobacterium phage Dole]UDL14735.1 hypothetical protein SEA_DEVERA_64 [Mycobacterium phage Devera]UDL14999.1 hypothetical protein SEA_ILLUMINE_62 [Mycobacterium phage Illumine]